MCVCVLCVLRVCVHTVGDRVQSVSVGECGCRVEGGDTVLYSQDEKECEASDVEVPLPSALTEVAVDLGIQGDMAVCR